MTRIELTHTIGGAISVARPLLRASTQTPCLNSRVPLACIIVIRSPICDRPMVLHRIVGRRRACSCPLGQPVNDASLLKGGRSGRYLTFDCVSFERPALCRCKGHGKQLKSTSSALAQLSIEPKGYEQNGYCLSPGPITDSY